MQNNKKERDLACCVLAIVDGIFYSLSFHRFFSSCISARGPLRYTARNPKITGNSIGSAAYNHSDLINLCEEITFCSTAPVVLFGILCLLFFFLSDLAIGQRLTFSKKFSQHMLMSSDASYFDFFSIFTSAYSSG